MIEMKLRGNERVIAILNNASGRRLRSAAARASRRAMGRVLATARSLVPVRSGKLRASLKVHRLSRNIGKDAVGYALYPSNEFSFGRGLNRTVVTRRRSTARAAGLAGKTVDFASVWNYAHIIETGLTRDGKRRNAAVHFLENALRRNVSNILETFQPEVASLFNR